MDCFLKTATIYVNDRNAKEIDTNAYFSEDSIFNASRQDTGAIHAAVLSGQNSADVWPADVVAVKDSVPESLVGSGLFDVKDLVVHVVEEHMKLESSYKYRYQKYTILVKLRVH